ncbi:MAG TPA: ParB N-terminal domain-containing protein [Pirellulales bacterium]
MRIDVEISKLITHPQCQRERQPEAWIAELREVLRAGHDFHDPIVVFQDEAGRMIVAAGNCRLEAARREGRETIDADVREGELRDAILHSVGSDLHGERRTAADKRKAIETLLCDPEWAAWSDRQISRRIGCDNKTVAAVRRDLVRREEIPHAETRTDSTGRQQPASKPKPAPSLAPLEPEPPRHAARLHDEHVEQSAVRFGQSEPEIVGRLPAVAIEPPKAVPATAAAFDERGFVAPLRLLSNFIDDRARAVGDRGREYQRAREIWRDMADLLKTWTGHDPTESKARLQSLSR